MSEIIKGHDERGNLIYFKSSTWEYWKKYDKNNNCIYYRISTCFEYWKEFDENNNLIHYKNSYNSEKWFKYDKNNKQIFITEKEFNEIEFRKKEKEYLSRTKCSRFEIMEI